MGVLSNVAWESAQRLKTYQEKTLEILSNGGKLAELAQVADMGMNLRVELVKEEIEKILSENISSEDKAKLIAEKLVNL